MKQPYKIKNTKNQKVVITTRRTKMENQTNQYAEIITKHKKSRLIKLMKIVDRKIVFLREAE